MISFQSKLNLQQTRNLEQLYQCCCEIDNFAYPQPWDFEPECFFLYYSGEDLLAFSCLISDGTIPQEILFMIHPNHRGQDCASQLLQAMQEHLQQTFYLNQKYTFPEALPFLSRMGFLPSHKECLMEWSGGEHEQSDANSISLQPCHLSELFTEIFHTCFSETPPLSEQTDDSSQCYFIMKTVPSQLHKKVSPSATATTVTNYGSYRQIIGCCILTAGQPSNRLFLSDFGILPSQRRKGYAAMALNCIGDMLAEGASLLLQVSTKNEAAFQLYTKHGFRIKEEITYLYLPLTNGQ